MNEKKSAEEYKAYVNFAAKALSNDPCRFSKATEQQADDKADLQF